MLKFRIYALTIWHIVWYSSFPMSFLVLFYYSYKKENQNDYIRAVRTWNVSVCVCSLKFCNCTYGNYLSRFNSCKIYLLLRDDEADDDIENK